MPYGSRMMVVRRQGSTGARLVAMVLALTFFMVGCGDSGPGEVGKDRSGLFVSEGPSIYRFAEIDCTEASVTATGPVQGSDADSAFDTVEIAFAGDGGSVALFAAGGSEPGSFGEFDGLDVDPESGARTAVVSFDGGDGELSFNCP